MQYVSQFSEATNSTPIGEITIDQVLTRIKTGASAKKINQIRSEKDKDKRAIIKRSLTGFTFAGTFNVRKIAELKQSSGLLVLDFDGIAEPKEFKQFVFDTEYVYAAWISPSNNGVKVLLKIPPVKNDAEYKEYYHAALDIFEIQADTSTTDISRLTFESYDPDILIRDPNKVELFEEKVISKDKTKAYDNSLPKEKRPSPKAPKLDQGVEDTFNSIVNGLTKQKVYYIVDESRNNFIYKLSADCNQFGIKMQDTINLCKYRYDYSALESEEIETTIASAYSKTVDFGKKSMKEYKPTASERTVNFPVAVFPKIIDDYINEQHEISSFDKNLLSSTYLWLMSTLIGNKMSLKVLGSWDVSPVMWMMIVAERGSTKTHAMNAVLKPAKMIQETGHQVFKDELKRWDEKSKEPRPRWRQLFLEDGTREGFIKAMDYNPGGLGLVKDELNGWLADMDKHAGGKGGDESFWVGSYNNETYTKNIKGDEDPTFSPKLFINLIGGTQPGIINNFTGEHVTTGLFDRFFMIPFVESEKLFTMTIEEPLFTDKYHEFIKHAYNSLNLNYSKYGKIRYRFDKDSATAYQSVYRYFQKIKFNTELNGIREYISKLITQISRVALTIEVTDQLFEGLGKSQNNQFNSVISVSSVKKAKDILVYYLNTAKTILFQIDKSSSMNDIIKDSRSIKKTDKAKAILTEVYYGRIEASMTEIAKKTGVQRTYLYKIKAHIEQEIAKKNGIKNK